MSKSDRNQTLFRVRGIFKLVFGLVILALVLVRAHIVLTLKPAGLASETAFTLVAQIGLLVLLALIGLMVFGRGIQLLSVARQQIES